MCADVCRIAIFFGLSRKFNVYVSIQWTAVFYIIFHHVSILHTYFKYSQKRTSILPKSFIQYVFFFGCCFFHSCFSRVAIYFCVAHFFFVPFVLFCDRVVFWLYLSILFYLPLDICIEIVFAYRIVFSV